jgi:hypothetical protein
VRLYPVKAVVRAVSGITVPTIILWLLNKDEDWYKNLEPWQKYGYFNIPIGRKPDGSPREIVRIPRSFEWGWAFGAATEMALEYFQYKDPEMIDRFLKQGAEQFIPLPPFKTPISLQIPLELAANYDFFHNRPIDPYWEVEYKDPEDRFSGYTTETAKAVGRFLNVSPRKAEHFLEASTGGLGMDMLQAVENLSRPRKIEQGADLPIVGRLFQRQRTKEERQKSLDYERKMMKKKINDLYESGQKEKAREKQRIWNQRHPEQRI